jgi:DNA-binding transcriptional LysR family regulator
VRLLADLDAVEADFREAAAVPKGRLRIDLASSLARKVLIPALPDFFERYPQIELDIGTSDRFIDLVQEGVDCVLRAGDLPDSTMVGRRVANLSQATVASVGYVQRYGTPRSLAELQDGHVAVNWSSPTTRRITPLEFMVGKRLREVTLPAPITVSGTEAYLACCEAGLGMAQFPRYRVEEELARGTLVELLPAMPPPPFPVSVVYQSQRQLPLRLRVFIDWIAEVMGTVH